ncbi:MAG: Fic family protein [Pseudobdellovibrionaceae bacterium]
MPGYQKLRWRSPLCSDVFQSLQDRAPKVFRSVSPEPKIHMGNYRKKLVPLHTPYFVSGQLSDLKPGIYWYGWNETIWLQLQRVTEDHHYFEMAAPLGPRYFKAETSKNGLRVQEVRLNETPFATSIPLPHPEPVKTPFDKNKLSPDWVKEVSLSQQRASSTLEEEAGINAGLIAANTLMYDALKKGQDLTSSLIEMVNLEVQNKEIGSGVIRGSEARIIDYPEGPYLVDLKETQMQNGYPVQYWYIPSSQVHFKINSWLKEANLVGPQTTVLELARLYQKFIIIHPFSNGNGRTSRVTLDYLFTRAGFPPLLYTMDLREVIFISVEELRDRMIESMGNHSHKSL